MHTNNLHFVSFIFFYIHNVGVDHDNIIFLSTPFPTIPMLGTYIYCCCNVILFYAGHKRCCIVSHRIASHRIASYRIVSSNIVSYRIISDALDKRVDRCIGQGGGYRHDLLRFCQSVWYCATQTTGGKAQILPDFPTASALDRVLPTQQSPTSIRERRLFGMD